MRLLTASFLLLLTTAGCKSEQEAYLEGLEADWNVLQRDLTLGSPADAKRICAAFLQKYPADHQHGNPHASTIKDRIESINAAIAAAEAKKERAQQARIREKQQQLLPELERLALRLMLRLGWLTDHAERAKNTVLSFTHKEGEYMTKARFGRGLAHVATAFPLKAARKIVKGVIYDGNKERYDPESLEALFELALLGPKTGLLGDTHAVFAYFQRSARNNLILYRAIAKLGPKGIDALYQDYLKAAKFADADDLIPFYKYLAERKSLWPTVSGPLYGEDVGFWVRRVRSGTASPFAGFLRKVLDRYDAAFLAQLDGGADAPLDTAGRIRKMDSMVALEHEAQRLAFSPDGDDLAIYNREKELLFYSLTDVAVRVTKKIESTQHQVYGLTYSPDGKHLVVADDGIRGGQGRVLVLEVETGKEIATLPTSGNKLYRLGFESKGRYLVGGGSNVDVWPWPPTATSTLTAAAPPHRLAKQSAFAIHPNHPLVITKNRDRELLVWNLETKKKIFHKKDVAYVLNLYLNPDGDRLLVDHGESKASIYRFDPSGGALVLEKQIGLDQRFSGFAPFDDLALFSGYDAPQVGIALIHHPDDPVYSFFGGWPWAFSADGARLALSGKDPDLRIWSMSERRALRH